MKNLFSRLLRLDLKKGEAAPDPSLHREGDRGDPAAPFHPVNEVEQLLMTAATDQAARAAFQRLLLTDDLLVATPEAPSRTEERTLQRSERIQILNVADHNGQAIPAVFTSQERLAECFGYGTGYIALNGETLFGILMNDGAVLNPASAYGVRWSPSDLAAMLGKPVRRVVEKETKVLLGAPPERPEKLIAKLTDALDRDGRIQEAWLALAHWPENDEWSWYLDLRSNASPDDMGPTIADALANIDKNEKPVDVVVNPPSADGGNGIRIKPVQLQ